MQNEPRRVYLLSPKDLSAETIAVTFAKTSRSPLPFDAIAAELSDEKSARFHEKWVIGYGHASVAEHAVLHLALENVSRLAVETIEGNRLASYTEKSTRYQQWDKDTFFLPEELQGTALEEPFISTCRTLFNTYAACIPPVQDYIRSTLAQGPDESQGAFRRRIRSAAVDVCRFLLPAAALANVGVTINARALEYALCKMLSDPLEEVRAIGEQIRKVGQSEAPTLIKYADCQPYLMETRNRLQKLAEGMSADDNPQDFSLLSWEPFGELKVLAALLFRFGQGGYGDTLRYVQSLSPEAQNRLISDLMDERGPFDQPLREFEYAQMTFEAVMDQGAYYEFKRHRMMTQTVQPLTSRLGFALPRAIREAGCEPDYLAAMRQAADLYERMVPLTANAAAYVVPNAFNRRVLFTLNLRQAYHLCRLRASTKAHFSIRRVAHQIAAAIRQVYPRLGAFLDVPGTETADSITTTFFSDLAHH